MAKKKLKADVVLKNYWRGNEEFADLFNAVLFDGQQIIDPNELSPLDSESSIVFEHRQYAETLESSRDIIKCVKVSERTGIKFVIAGIEDQWGIDYAMPIRVMGYDYQAYDKQLLDKKDKYRGRLSGDELLCGIPKGEKFYPVITIVFYTGEKPWDGPTSLLDMVDIPEVYRPFMTDYKINLVEVRNCNYNFKNVNNLHFVTLMQILLDCNTTRKEARKRINEYCEFNKVDKKVTMAVAGATNANIDYEKIEKGAVNMCTFVDEIQKNSKVEGKAEGIISTCRSIGCNTEKTLELLVSQLNVTRKEAEDILADYEKKKNSQ